MKKTNVKSSQHKVKRAIKNKKRLADKPKISSHEANIARIRQENREITVILEVKPFKQTQLPTQKRRTQKFIQEVATYAINQEKWRAADLFCKEHGWQFKIITEKELGL
jgi:hypothetical protein